MSRRAAVVAVLAVLAAARVVHASPDDPPLPNPGSPTLPLPLAPDPDVRPPDDSVRPPDVDGLGVMSIRTGTFGDVDASLAHQLEGNAIGLVPGARIALVAHTFVDLALPVADRSGDVALGNAMVGIGWLPEDDGVVGIELRVAAATSPSTGGGATALATLAAPQVARAELVLPHTTSAELVADWRWRGDAWWLQPEAGLAAWWQPAGYATVARAALAGGVRIAPWLDLTASFVMRLDVTSRDSSNNFVHAVLAGAVLHTTSGELAIRAEVPIDDGALDDHRFLIGLELRAR